MEEYQLIETRKYVIKNVKKKRETERFPSFFP